MTEKKKKFSRSDIASFLAVALSLAALAIGIIETRIMAQQQEVMVEQQKGSVWPYIEVKSGITISNSLSDTLTFNATAENKGVGPAIVKEIRIQIHDKAYNNFQDFTAAMDSIIGNENYELLQFAISKSPNSVYKPSEKRNLFSMRLLNKELFYSKIGFFNISLKYCSIYDDCWMENGKEIEE